MDYTPILNGPPGFVILALVFAVAAYLRQVSASAIELSDKIRGGLVWNYPIAEPLPKHTKLKLESLERTHNTLSSVASPVMVWFVIVAALRVVLYSVLALPLLPSAVARIGKFLPWVDLTITTGVFLMFVALGLIHRRSRQNNATVRRLTDEWEAGRRQGSR
jgi:hypothetical protein